MRTILVAAIAVGLCLSAAAQSSAVYQLSFEASWSAQTHPSGFPGNPHFSPLVGGTHQVNSALWAPESLASAGMRSMAETGASGALLAEVAGMQTRGTAQNALSGGAVSLSPGSVSMPINVTEAFPLVTVVSMLAPSPDWFVGTHGLNLFQNGSWTPEAVVPLNVYDAGTDSGQSYTAPDSPTSPAVTISQIQVSPFLVSGVLVPVGVFRFTLQSVTASESAPSRAFTISEARPNPSTAAASFVVSLPRATRLVANAFDILGRQVVSVLNEETPAGTQDLVVDTSALPSGVYVLRAEADGEVVARRFTVR